MIIYRKLSIKPSARIICISDIHGNLDLLKILLEKVHFSESDELFLVGDLFAKGKQCLETLHYIMKLSEKENVHPIRGNCDRTDELNENDAQWVEALPHILETDKYIFVHGGLPSMDFASFEPSECMKLDDFMERAESFDKYVITGHWPVNNYCHDIISLAPIVNDEKKIIAIDGGCVVNEGGQLNALIIENGKFSCESADILLEAVVTKPQTASSDPFTVCFQDRNIEIIERGDVFSICRHIKTGRTLTLPNNAIWTDRDGKLCATGTRATTYFLPLSEGDRVKVIDVYSDRVHIKKNGICGYVYKKNLT